MRLLCAAIAMLAVAAPAHAAWTPPQRLGRPAHFPGLVVARDGHALLTGYGSRGAQLLTLPPGGMEPIARRTVADRPWFLTYGRRSTIGFRASAGAVFGTIADPLRRTQPIAGAADLAVNPRGEAVAMWVATRGRRALTRYAVRPPGGRFGKPRTIAIARGFDEFWGLFESGEMGEAVAIDGDGTVTFALNHESGEYGDRRREVRVVTIHRGGRPGPQEVVGPHKGFAGVELEVAASGRTAIAWTSSDLGEEVNLPVEVWAASRRAGSRRFRRAQRLEANGAPPAVTRGYLSLAVAPNGEALVAWSTPSRRTGQFRRYVVEVASAPPGRRFGAPRLVAIGGIEVDVALAGDGRAALTWVTSEEPQVGIQVFAALRPRRGARFGPPEAVSPEEDAQSPVVAYDPSTGHPLIAWSATPGAATGSVEDTGGRPAPRALSLARFVP